MPVTSGNPQSDLRPTVEDSGGENEVACYRALISFVMKVRINRMNLISFVEALKAQALTETTKSADPADPDKRNSRYSWRSKRLK
jgi:hypothetical protein